MERLLAVSAVLVPFCSAAVKMWNLKPVLGGGHPSRPHRRALGAGRGRRLPRKRQNSSDRHIKGSRGFGVYGGLIDADPVRPIPSGGSAGGHGRDSSEALSHRSPSGP